MYVEPVSSKDLAASAFPALGLQAMHRCHAWLFILIAGDLNSGPHTHVAGTLLTEPCHQPPWFYIFKMLLASPNQSKKTEGKEGGRNVMCSRDCNVFAVWLFTRKGAGLGHKDQRSKEISAVVEL